MYCGNVFKQEAEILYHEILPGCLQSSNLSFVVTAGGNHVAQWLIGGALNQFPDEDGLTCRNHVPNTWDGIEHLVNLFIPYLVFLDFRH